MTDSMIERVARAILEVWNRSEGRAVTLEDLRSGHEQNLPTLSKMLTTLMDEARAAIEALREPTDAMQAAVRELLERRYLGGQSWDLSDPFLSEVITVAIDAALGERK